MTLPILNAVRICCGSGGTISATDIILSTIIILAVVGLSGLITYLIMNR